MAQPKKPMLKGLFHGKTKISTTGKAYLRNFGKGHLKIADGNIKFYVAKGRFSKQKDLAKQFQLADVEKVTLTRGELEVTLRFERLSFVIKDKKFSNFIYGKIKEHLSNTEGQSQSLPDAKEPLTTDQNAIGLSTDTSLAPKIENVPTYSPPILSTNTPFPAQSSTVSEILEKENVAEAVTLAFSAADSVFDALMCLNGRVDWRSLQTHAKLAEEKTRKLAQKRLFESSGLDGSLFLSSVEERDVTAITMEGQRLLDAMIQCFQEEQSELRKARNAASAYFMLNDIVFASVVNDTDINEEVTAFKANIEELSAATTMQAQKILEPLAHLTGEEQREPYVDQARTAFKKQLSIMVAQ